MIKYYKGQHVICLTEAVIEQHEKTQRKVRESIRPEALRWKP
jgi:histone acetyltransferase HTATIP